MTSVVTPPAPKVPNASSEEMLALEWSNAPKEFFVSSMPSFVAFAATV